MRELGDIYESARASIPLSLFPERKALLPWSQLDERVHSELDVLQDRIFSALRGDQQLLANHHRVIDDFNRGVRNGVLAAPGELPPPPAGRIARSPFQWGQTVGFHTKGRGGKELSLIKQFTIATHLLAYEFRQLDLAFRRPVDFLMRNIGPDRADEFGELVFAVPILLNYRPELVAGIIEVPGFSFSAYHIAQSPAPSHLDYLLQGIVALFDPEPKSWIRVAANFGLATMPFIDGTTLTSEDFQAPQQMAEVVARKPIAAQMIVRRQMSRIELARRWIGSKIGAIEFEETERAAPTLWDVYQSTQVATIRGHRSYLADVVANNVARLLSERVELSLAPQDSRLAYLRRHLPAFTRGFDARSDRVVDVRAIASAQYGRNLSDGLRRFENGGLYVAGVSEALAELVVVVNELHHALENTQAFVRHVLVENQETAVSDHLSDLFEAYPSLPVELFGEHLQYEFFSRTQIQTRSPFDLMRRALFHLVHAAQPSNEQDDSVPMLLGEARTSLRHLLALADAPAARKESKDKSGGASYFVVSSGKEGDMVKPEENVITIAARQFEQEFETLTRVIQGISQRLYMARLLSKTQDSFGPDYADRRGTRGVT